MTAPPRDHGGGGIGVVDGDPAVFAALSDTEVTTLCDLLRKLDPAGA